MKDYKNKDFIFLKIDLGKIPTNQIINNISKFNRELFSDFSILSECELYLKYKPNVFSLHELVQDYFTYSTGIKYAHMSGLYGFWYVIPKDKIDIANYIQEKFPYKKHLVKKKQLKGLSGFLFHRDNMIENFDYMMKNKYTGSDLFIEKIITKMYGYRAYIAKVRKTKIKKILENV